MGMRIFKFLNKRRGRKMNLTSKNLKNELWKTLQELRKKKIESTNADAISRQAKEILNATKVEIKITDLLGYEPSIELSDFIGV